MKWHLSCLNLAVTIAKKATVRMDGLISKALRTIIVHCTERHNQALQALLNTPVLDDTFEEFDRKLLAGMEHTGQFRRLIGISA